MAAAVQPGVRPTMQTAGRLHHVELYVSALEDSLRFWTPFLTKLGYKEHQRWAKGVSYIFNGTYIVFVQADAEFVAAGYHRKRIGLNHIAFCASSRRQVDEITDWARANGFQILYEDRHPKVGGQYALYCEDPNRIKVELVAPEDEA